MKHQAAFLWYTFIALTGISSIVLIYADRIKGGPDEQWWAPLLFMGITAYAITRCVRNAKKDWT